MERKITNHAENQSATKTANRSRTSCLGRNAYAMLFALMLFVGMGTAWGQVARVTVDGGTPQTFAQLVNQNPQGAFNYVAGLAAGTSAANPRTVLIEILEDCTLSSNFSFSKNYTNITIKTGEELSTKSLIHGSYTGRLITFGGTLSTLTFENIILDGNNQSGGLLSTSKDLNINSGVILKNCSISGSTGGGLITITGGTATIDGATLQGGSATGTGANGRGGLIHVSGGNLSIANATLENGTAVNGGCIWFGGTALNISNTKIQGSNSATTNGGVLYVNAGTVTISGSTTTLKNGTAAAGGIVYVNGGSVNVQDATLESGTASSQGGIISSTNGTATLNISHATLKNGSAGDGGIIYFTGANATLTIEESMLQDVTTATNGGILYMNGGTVSINGGSILQNATATTNGGLVYVNGGTLNVKSATLQNGQASSGAIISKAGTGALNIGDTDSFVTINGGSTTSTLINITAGATTMTNTTINGQTSSGTLVSDAGTGALSFTDSFINGSTTATDNALVMKSNTGAVDFINTTITRNQSKGNGFINTSSGVVTFEGCTIDGSNNTSATAPLIKMGTGALTLNNTTVTGHTVSASNVCAVDATTGTAKVNVSGSTSIYGNTSNGINANLSVNGTNRLMLTAYLFNAIGVTTPQGENEQFAQLTETVEGVENLLNDTNSELIAVLQSTTAIKWISSDNKYQLVTNPGNNQTYSYYTTLKAAVEAAANNGIINSLVDEDTIDEAITTTKAITIQPGAELERLTLYRGASVTGNLITTNAALTLQNITLDGGEVEATGSLIKVDAGALTLNNTTVNGGKTAGTLINDTGTGTMTITDSEINGSTVANSGNLINKIANAATGGVNMTSTTFNGNSVTGDLITFSNTGTNRTMNVTFDNCTVNGATTGSGSLVSKTTDGTFSATNGTAFNGNGSTGSMINLSNSDDAVTFSNTTINGGTSTGNLFTDAGTGTLSFTDCSINGSTVDAANTLITKSNTGTVAFANTTITRNHSQGNGFKSTSSGTVSFTDCIIDGSENTSATAPLIKSGTGTLALTNTTVTGHNVSASDVCAVDATSVTGNIDVSGETSISGNTSNDVAANLKVSGTNILRIPATSELAMTVGVTSTDHHSNGDQFAVLGNKDTSLGYQYFNNDLDQSLYGKKSGTTNVVWGTYSVPGSDSKFRIFTGTDYAYFDTFEAAVAQSNNMSTSVTIQALVAEYSAANAVSFTASHNVTIAPEKEFVPDGTFTLKRGAVAGNLLTFSNSSANTLTLMNTTIDGTANTGVTTTGSLIKIDGTNILTLNNSSAINNTASSSGVCGIDASGSSGKVNLVGNVNVKDNTANGANANLKVTGTTRLTLTGNISGEVGVTTSQGMGQQFAYGNKSYTGYGALKNDTNENLRPYYYTNTNIYWQYCYRGLAYTFSGNPLKAKVSNYDLTYTDIPNVVDQVPYNGSNVTVTDLTYFGSAATLRHKNLFFTEEMLDKMANGAVIGMPEIVAQFTQAIMEAVEGYTEGDRNADFPGTKNVWKKAEYNPETNQIEYTLKYLQLMTEDQPLDFVFSIDQTGTMCTSDATAYGVTAPRVIWMMALLQRTAYELVSKNEIAEAGYDNKVAFIPWGNTTPTVSNFMSTNDEITEWFSGPDAYSHAAEGTNHALAALACVQMAHSSLEANRMPVIIYMSDFQANAHTNKDKPAVKELRETTLYKTYAINIFADASAYGNYYQNSGVYFANKPEQFMEVFSAIVKDAIGFYLNKPLVVEDGLSTPLAGKTPSAGSADGQLGATAEQASWTLGQQTPLLNAGNLYSSAFTVELEDDAVYSGAMPTNASLTVENDGVEVNRIDDSPILGKPLILVLKGNNASGAPIANATFTLTRGGNTWSLTTDADGQIVLPWGASDVVGATTAESRFAFIPDYNYTLTQNTTSTGFVMPSGSWTLSVGSDYKITASGATPAMEAHAGNLEIYNESVIIARVSNDNGNTWTYHEYLINGNYDPDWGDSPEQQGAFDKAMSLGGDVIIETLLESHERYTLTEGFTFNGDITSLTLRTTQDDHWNPATGDPATRFTSTIARGDDFGSLLDFAISDASFTIENIILDGGYNFDDPSSGYSCDDDGGLVYMGSGTLYIKDATLQNSYATGVGGGIYTDGDVYLSGTLTFTGCAADGDGGGAIYAEGSVTINGQAEFTNCSTGYDPSSKPGNCYGGAINANEITLIGNISFDGCKASYNGGALYGNTISLSTSSPDDMISITNCSANNGCNGGGIYANGPVNLAGNVTITGCSAVAHQSPGGAEGAGGGIYLKDNASLTMSGLIVIEGNTHGKGDVDDDVYLDAASEKNVIIGEDGLRCGSHIGIYKTSGYTNDANSISYTVIAQGTASNCQNAYSNGFFFDDRGLYGVYNLNYGTHYTNTNLYFIETWEGQAPEAVAGTDYVLIGDYVSEVKTDKGMAYFAKDVNNGKDYASKTVTLSNDIDLSGRYWVPIGQAVMGSCSTSGNPFKGTFDGQGKIISNMKSVLPYQDMGLFGYVEGGTITNTFVESGTLEGTYTDGTGTSTAFVGGLVGSLDDGTVTYSEAMVSLTNSTNANCTMGGLVGRMDNEIIHSSMAMPEMTNGTMMGGLVGQMEQGTMENSFANAKFNIDATMTTWTIGGLAGSIVETEIGNCYVMQRGTVPTAATGKVFGWLAGDADEISVHHCYIPDGYTNYFGSGTESVSESGAYTATALENDKYGYGQNDQKVGENDHLVDLLNNWVGEQDAEDGYAQWTRTMASPINGDYPVLMMPTFDGENVNVCLGSKDGLFITYNTDLNNEIQKYNAATDGGNIYLYATNPTEINTNTNDDVRVYIHENVGVLQADGNKLNARVGVTFDNSSTGFMAYDWHMFSTALSDASLGIDYGTPAAGVGFGHQIADGDITLTKYGYYPTNTPFASFDFYAYDEPSRHYINLKRNTGNHWHQVTQEPIEYTNEEKLLKGKGYLMAIDKETMLMANGVLNNGDVPTEELKYTTSENEGDARQTGVNLIGNPYQSYLDFEMFAKDDSENSWASPNSGKVLDNAYYILDADRGGYITYPDQASENPVYAPRYIHPHQGFFVAVGSATTLTFTNDMRRAEGNEYSYFRGEHINYPLVNLICTDSDGKRDFTTVEIDRLEQGGARKLMNMRAGDASLYAHFNNQGYQALYAPQGVREVPVRLDVFEDGVFTMTWSMFHGDFGYVHLIDNLTGADIDLTTTDSYRFEASTDDYASRFRLVFDVTGIEEYDDDQDGPSTGSGTFAFFDGNTWVVNGEGTLQLFDVNGRCLMSTNAEGPESSVTLPKVATGVYVLRLTNGNGTRVQKVVVR